MPSLPRRRIPAIVGPDSVQPCVTMPGRDGGGHATDVNDGPDLRALRRRTLPGPGGHDGAPARPYLSDNTSLDAVLSLFKTHLPQTNLILNWIDGLSTHFICSCITPGWLDYVQAAGIVSHRRGASRRAHSDNQPNLSSMPHWFVPLFVCSIFANSVPFHFFLPPLRNRYLLSTHSRTYTHIHTHTRTLSISRTVSLTHTTSLAPTPTSSDMKGSSKTLCQRARRLAGHSGHSACPARMNWRCQRCRRTGGVASAPAASSRTRFVWRNWACS